MTNELNRRTIPQQWLQIVGGIMLAIIAFFAQQTFQSQKNLETAVNNLTILTATIKAENTGQIGKINDIDRRVQKLEGDVYYYHKSDNTRLENLQRVK